MSIVKLKIVVFTIQVVSRPLLYVHLGPRENYLSRRKTRFGYLYLDLDRQILEMDIQVQDLTKRRMKMLFREGVGPGGKVNLERALLPSTRMGGHFVSGHVDGTGVIEAIEPRGKDFFFRIKPDADKLKYIVSKGCITVDGITLTVSEVDESGFAIWLIPHTMEVTNLHTKQVGDRVNLEYDLIAKYVEKLFAPQG